MRPGGVTALLLALVVVSGCTGDGPARVEEPRSTGARPPNVLVIVTDDQRFDTMTALPRTRRIFGREGTTFPNAFVTTPQCCPSRASIMTGQYSHNNGVLENNDGDLLVQETTVQARLRQAGYLTAITGKYLQGRPVSEDPPFFDHWATMGWGYYDANFNVDGDMRAVHRYSTDYMARTAARYLDDFERSDGTPWFIYIAPPAPHLPYTPARRYRAARVRRLRANPALREADLGDKPSYFSDPLLVEKTGFTLAEGRALYRKQMRTLLAVDDLVADVFARMDTLDETSDTLAFFISDNGHLLGEHGLFGKRLPYEASVRVPLLMRWPGRVAAGARDERMVAGIDLAPTILAAAGLEVEPGSMDGRSLLSDHSRDALLLEQYENGHIPDWASILTPRSQYIAYLERGSHERLYGEYYDLRKDPWQLDNLLKAGTTTEPRGAARAARLLAAALDCAGSECP